MYFFAFCIHIKQPWCFGPLGCIWVLFLSMFQILFQQVNWICGFDFEYTNRNFFLFSALDLGWFFGLILTNTLVEHDSWLISHVVQGEVITGITSSLPSSDFVVVASTFDFPTFTDTFTLSLISGSFSVAFGSSALDTTTGAAREKPFFDAFATVA